MAFVAGDRLGPYEIRALIGKGGMGEVYRAWDPRVERDVAIKVSAQQFTERFEREAKVIAGLNHPNICTLFDVGPNYLVMEFIEGPTLAERIEEGRAPLDEALAIARQIAAALDYAHDRTVVHRDLKPANVKIRPDGGVKVLDFGLAKLGAPTPAAASSSPADSPTLTMAMTEAGMILGTAAYMAPEQARGKPVDKRADLWAFGVVLYEMLTAQRLFQGSDFTEIMASVVKDQPDLTRVPVKVRPLLARCLQKDPQKRLRDAGDLDLLLADAPLGSSVKSNPLWMAVAAVLALAAAAAWWAPWRTPLPTAEVVRFEVPPPDKTANIPILSPDGRKLVLPAAPNGRIALYLRSLDSTEWRVLAGTENLDASASFWSPDSRFLVFESGRKVKKIDINGGPAQVVADFNDAMIGGAWTRDGVLILGSTRGLFKVSASGGAVSPLTTLNAARGEVRHLLPFLLPDDRHFLYTGVSTNPANSGLFARSLDAKPDDHAASKLLLPGNDVGAVYVPLADSTTGRLLFYRDGTLMAQPFDPGRLELTGEAVPIAERVGRYLNGGLFTTSANGVLAFTPSGMVSTFELSWYDRAGKYLGAAAPAADYNDVALSPDGTRVATSRRSSGSGLDVWLTDLVRGVPTRFTFDPSDDISPAWSPDGRRIAFQSNRGSSPALYGKLSSGVGSEELLQARGGFPHWSPDGRFLLYAVTDPKTRSDLWVLPLEGDRKPTPYLKTEFDESEGQFSPDGRFVAYRSDESGGQQEIFVQPFPAGAGGGGKWQISTGGGTQPLWRRDGKELFFVSGDRTVMSVEMSTSPTFKAGVPKPLFDAPFRQGSATLNVFRYDVTADGQKFVIVGASQDSSTTPITVVLNWPALLKK